MIETTWLIIISAAPLIAGVVLFFVNALRVKNLNLQNEKLREELKKLRRERASRDSSIITVSPEEVEKYGRKYNQAEFDYKKFLSMAGVVFFSSILIPPMLYLSSPHKSITSAESLQYEARIRELGSELQRKNNSIEALQKELKKKTTLLFDDCNEAIPYVRQELSKRFMQKEFNANFSSCNGSCHAKIDNGKVTVTLGTSNESASFSVDETGLIQCEPFQIR